MMSDDYDDVSIKMKRFENLLKILKDKNEVTLKISHTIFIIDTHLTILINIVL